MHKLLEITNLGKRYEGFALKNFNLSLEPDRVVGLVGSNGAGKTTVLKTILGLVSADQGHVRLFGESVTPNDATLGRTKQRIGVVFDSCAFPPDCLTKDVGIIGKASFSTWDNAQWNNLLERFKISPKKKVSDLSRGMGMKLTLAFALVHNPDLLLLDEATAGLDPLAREEVLGILRTFMEHEGHSILMSTHITTDLEKIADSIVCLDDGATVFDVPRETITDEAGIARCRIAELDAILTSGAYSPCQLYLMRNEYGIDLLVPDRFAFARMFPDIAIERSTIEEYLTLRLKGEAL